MQFLLDAHMPPTLGELLLSHGHAYRHIAVIGQRSAKDIEILQLAAASNEVILTHDLDFGNLLAFAQTSSPSVIIFRIHKIQAQVFYQILVNNWHVLEKPLQDGAIIIIEKDSIRIRKLPVRPK